MMFYSRSAAAMWDQSYTRRFWQGVKAPKFRISLNKAFEYVALYGPNLMWDVPHRTVEPIKSLELPGIPEQLLMMQQQERQGNTIVSKLSEGWLNYTPRELPGGGSGNAKRTGADRRAGEGPGRDVAERLSLPRQRPQDHRLLPRVPEDLLIDPDFKTLQKAKWIALRHLDTVDDLVERFPGLKREQFKNGGGLESSWHYGETKGKDDGGVSDRKSG
jgi:hypothetical protein